MKCAIYPGSFDPVTNGHLDIIVRARAVFDRLIVAVAVNPKKAGLFSFDERVEMIRAVTGELSGLEVVAFHGLVADYCHEHDIPCIVRGLRVVSEFEYEFQMHTMNKRLNPRLDTFFMMTSEEYFYLSSSLVREVYAFGGQVEGLVPPLVSKRLREKLWEDAQ